MAREAVVPAGGVVLVFGRHGRHLRGVHDAKVAPHVHRRRQEDRVRVHVEQRVDVQQQTLRPTRDESAVFSKNCFLANPFPDAEAIDEFNKGES